MRRTSPMNATLAEIGSHLRAWRCYRRQTQSELALAVGLTQTSVSNYEAGIRDITISALLAIAAQLEVELQTLIAMDPPVVLTRLPPGPGRTVIARHVDADYTRRMEPDAVLAAARSVTIGG